MYCMYLCIHYVLAEVSVVGIGIGRYRFNYLDEVLQVNKISINMNTMIYDMCFVPAISCNIYITYRYIQRNCVLIAHTYVMYYTYNYIPLE
jgi:hypothetical protein